MLDRLWLLLNGVHIDGSRHKSKVGRVSILIEVTDTSMATGRMMMQMVGAFAELEHANI